MNDLFFVRTRSEHYNEAGELIGVYEAFEKGSTGYAVPKLYKEGTAKSLVNRRNKRQYRHNKIKSWMVPVTITYPMGDQVEAAQTR